MERERAFRVVRGGISRVPDESVDRGQALMVGAILLLLLVSTAYVAAQVQVAPVLQADAEQRHARQLAADAQRLQSDMIKVASTGQRQAHTIQMGTQYPFRTLLLHPPDPSSSLFDRHDLAVRLRHARAVDPEIADFLDGSTRLYSSTAVNLEPRYYEFDSAPTLRLEHGTLYAAYGDRKELSAHGGLVDGRQVNLIAVQADTHLTTSRPITIQQEPLSASAETVQIRDDGSPIEFHLQTSQSMEMWRDVLGSELSRGPDDSRYVDSLDLNTSTDPHTLVIRMVEGEQYQLNVAKVGLRRGGETGFSRRDVPEAAYLTSATSTTPVVGEEQSTVLTVQVRDHYHNPAPSVPVEARDGAGRILGDATKLSDGAGYVSFRYEAPEVAGSVGDVPAARDTVTVRVDGRAEDHWSVEYHIEVQNTHESGDD